MDERTYKEWNKTETTSVTMKGALCIFWTNPLFHWDTGGYSTKPHNPATSLFIMSDSHQWVRRNMSGQATLWDEWFCSQKQRRDWLSPHEAHASWFLFHSDLFKSKYFSMVSSSLYISTSSTLRASNFLKPFTCIFSLETNSVKQTRLVLLLSRQITRRRCRRGLWLVRTHNNSARIPVS